jgi:pimeloyl-ACP methyl ester carboxylesterase
MISRGLLLMLVFVVGTVAATETPHVGYLRKNPKNDTVIVFVHGVLGDAVQTWTNDRTKASFPQLLADDPAFKAVNVYVHGYVSPKIKRAQDVEELARRLGDYLNTDGVFKRHKRVVFICHSMGGLIVRAYLLKTLPPADKVPLIYFFGTPSAGAEAASISALASKNPQFENMKPFERESYVSDLAKRWQATGELPNVQYSRKIYSYCAYEVQKYLGYLVVNELSASHLCNMEPRAVDADHMDMVKPENRDAESYRYFASAFNFATGAVGKFVAANAAIESVKATGSREVVYAFKTAPVKPDTFNVECNQSREGTLRVPVALSAREKLVTGRIEVHEASNISAKVFEPQLESGEHLGFRYKVSGLSKPTKECPSGTVRAEVKYLTVTDR